MAKCNYCGAEYPERAMKEVFVGRRLLMCPKCDAKGEQEMSAHVSIWMNSYTAKKIKDWTKRSGR